MRTDIQSAILFLVFAVFLADVFGEHPFQDSKVAVRNKRQTCVNKHRSCYQYKNYGYCTSQSYRQWMSQNCRLACGYCTTTSNSAKCYDSNNFCSDWARKGECTRNPRYMLINCRRSCRKCTVVNKVNGNWGSWSSYGPCSVSCGKGIQKRTRSCNKPAPKNGGRSCAGSSSSTTTCTRNNCKVDGNWGAWSSWSKCSKSCDKGIQQRSRSCNQPSPQHGGKNCAGSNVQQLNCNNHQCKIDGNWGAWSSWSKCSKSCDKGIQQRSRSCNQPSPQHGGKNCAGSNVQQLNCNNHQCKINGRWSSWGSWSECSATCGNTGEKIRMRACNNPRPQHGGTECPGDMSYRSPCNRKSCPLSPIDGNWSPWESWTTCSPECLRSRTRHCDNPQPQNGGRLCIGDSLVMEECSGGNCKGEDKEKCGTRIQRGRIVGGTKVYPGEYPWQVGIKRIFQSKVFCGGSLLNNEWIVTASHCVDGEDAEILQIVLGDVDQSTQDGQEIFVGVKQYFKHPNYNSLNYDNDIALIQLEQKITFSKFIKPICLPTVTTPPAVGTKCFVTGFGRIQEGGALSLSLRQAELPVVSQAVCTEAYQDYQPLTKNMFCAGRPEGGIDSCQGDSGGPYVCQNEDGRFYLAGVVSWGVGCARQKRYGVYANVAVLKSWVNKKTNETQNEP